MKDNEEKFLQSALEIRKALKINTKRQSMWSIIESQQNLQQSDTNLPAPAVWKNCSDYEHQIANILTFLAEKKH
jgi:hypothetical protein